MLAANVLGISEEGELEFRLHSLHKFTMEFRKFNYSRLPLFCQYFVSGSLFSSHKRFRQFMVLQLSYLKVLCD